VAAEIAATVVAVPVDVGGRVNAGDTLARLDCARFDAQLAGAEATLRRAEASTRFATRQLRRARDLRKNNSISEELLDQRETELDASRSDVASARAAVTQAELDIAACTVTAPVDGIVTGRHASVGDYVTPGSPVVDLVADAGIEVSVALRLDQIDDFLAAAERHFVTRAQRYPLSLRSVVDAVDVVSRTREARLVFNGTPALPGSPGRVHWAGRSALIPAEYLLRRGGVLGVLIADGGHARFLVLPDALEGRPSPSALPDDSLLIDEGRQRLGDGDPILVVSPGTPVE
jgi:RND family efflux transporter MFP subunit